MVTGFIVAAPSSAPKSARGDTGAPENSRHNVTQVSIVWERLRRTQNTTCGKLRSFPSAITGHSCRSRHPLADVGLDLSASCGFQREQPRGGGALA